MKQTMHMQTLTRFAVKRLVLSSVLLLVMIVLALHSSSAISADESADTVDHTRALLEKMVETRRIISKEKQQWAMGEEILANRIDLVQREIDSLRDKLSETKSSIAKANTKTDKLIEQKQKLKKASTALRSTVTTLENRTQQLLRRVPTPLRERVKPLSQRLPDSSAETKLSLAERFQNVIGILNEVNKFNREITVTSEVRELDNGNSAEVTAMYVGLGQGYYVGANARIGGIGTATDDGWVWTPTNDAAPYIAQAIAILKNEQPASFVTLPLKVK